MLFAYENAVIRPEPVVLGKARMKLSCIAQGSSPLPLPHSVERLWSIYYRCMRWKASRSLQVVQVSPDDQGVSAWSPKKVLLARTPVVFMAASIGLYGGKS